MRRSVPSLSLPLLFITLAAYALRMLRLNWQPLWWDEGYSVFFATEPVPAMLALTAQDIHPPLYYTALHAWIALLTDAQPVVLRLFSVGVGVVAVPIAGILVYRLSGGNSKAGALTALLLAMNPLHIYYSQEVRMYSLAATLGLASTLLLVKWIAEIRQNNRANSYLVAYAVCTALLLYTLYYATILVAFQLAWAGWLLWRMRRGYLTLLAALGGVLLALLPWLAYAVPKLTAYVGDKVLADSDVSLNAYSYLYRHITAFIVGHSAREWAPLGYLTLLAVAAIVALLLTARRRPTDLEKQSDIFRFAETVALLAVLVIGPLVVGYLINTRYPFFPENGERLLLFVLPYLLSLIAVGVVYSRLRDCLKTAFLAPILALSLVGIVSYYSIPRHVELDYRPIVATVAINGSDQDTVLALFPWQVGYWRAYGPRGDDRRLIPPQPHSVGQEILIWNEEVRVHVDSLLAADVLWFPEPLALGSALPGEIEAHLWKTATNVRNEWYSDATRLTAWTRRQPVSADQGVNASAGGTVIRNLDATPTTIASDNSVLQVAIDWQSSEAEPPIFVAALVDAQGRTWAKRDFQPPLEQSSEQAASTIRRSNYGIQIPVGIPPGDYSLQLSILDEAGVPVLIDGGSTSSDKRAVTVTKIQVTQPDAPAEIVRAPVVFRHNGSPSEDEVQILGVGGVSQSPEVLAGTQLKFDLVLRNKSTPKTKHSVTAAVVDGDGNSVASYSGWPLPDYPTNVWPPETIVSVPIAIQLPAYVEAGQYEVQASVADVTGDAGQSSEMLFNVAVRNRPVSYIAAEPAILLDDAVQFGSHALLYGYEFEEHEDVYQLSLDWQALQPILPQHNIFIHVVTDNDDIVLQADGEPVTMSGQAPTGSWRENEYITTLHELPIPETLDGNWIDEYTIRVGLYDPISGVRLPTFVAGDPTGDFVPLSLASEP